MKKNILRTIASWALRALMVLLFIFSLQIAVLAFPQVLIRDYAEYGSVRLYSDFSSNEQISDLAEEVELRLKTSGFYDSSQTKRVFLIESQSLYSLLVKLSLLRDPPQGFNLSILGNSFVSTSKIDALSEITGGLPRYSIWEGSYAHIMAHEIGHQYIVDSIGRITLPHWKREGLPEYIANIGTIRRDSLASLKSRIEVLQDDMAWSATRDWDRIHYEAGLLVEFLLDVKGYTLDDIIADSVTREETYAEMLSWAD